MSSSTSSVLQNKQPNTFMYPPQPPPTQVGVQSINNSSSSINNPKSSGSLLKNGTIQPVAIVRPPDIYNSVKDLRFFRIPMYALVLVDLFATIVLALVTIRWSTSVDLNIPLLYLFLLLLQIPHLFTSPGLLAIIFDSRNFYFINMITVIFGLAWVANFISLVWRSVCLGYEGSLTCPTLDPGRWLAWTVWGLVFVLFITSLVTFILLIFYIRGLKRNLIMEYDVLERQRVTQQTIESIASLQYDGNNMSQQFDQHAISFRQSPDLYFARTRVRTLAGIDMFIYLTATLLRIIFLYGVGFWYVPYMQVLHLFLWIWMLDIGGSIDYKTPIYLGGTDASNSDLLVQITFYAFIFATIADTAALLLCAWDVIIVTLSVFTILEIVFGYLILFSFIGLLLYDIYSIYSLSTVVDQLSRLVVNKQHYQ
jgi:hypothetical protein